VLSARKNTGGSMIKHLITGGELDKDAILNLLDLAQSMKAGKYDEKPLASKQVLLSFDKPSFRTRLSFMAASNKLGAHVIESSGLNRKHEEPKDFIRVVQGYCDVLMIRTYHDWVLEEMVQYADIPIINGLTDHFHPCQTLADLMALKECFGKLSGLKVAYIGDGNNILHSLLLMAGKLGITAHYCCPPRHQPKDFVLKQLPSNQVVHAFEKPEEAVKGCQAVYTDVWTSMGFSQKDSSDFKGFQVNQALMNQAASNCVFMHCMPMNRGEEVSADLPDETCSVIFKQSENRMHVQQALLCMLFQEEAVAC